MCWGRKTITEDIQQPLEVGIINLIFRKGNWDTERLSNLPKATQLISGGARMQIQQSDLKVNTY